MGRREIQRRERGESHSLFRMPFRISKRRDWHVDQLFNSLSARQARMERGAAANKQEAASTPHCREVIGEAAKLDAVFHVRIAAACTFRRKRDTPCKHSVNAILTDTEIQVTKREKRISGAFKPIILATCRPRDPLLRATIVKAILRAHKEQMKSQLINISMQKVVAKAEAPIVANPIKQKPPKIVSCLAYGVVSVSISLFNKTIFSV